MRFDRNRDGYPAFQVWRPSSVGSTVYNKIGEAQLQSDQVTGSGTYRTAHITLTGNNTIEFQSGDVVGYYHPPDARYQVRTIRTNGYRLYRFNNPSASIRSANINLDMANNDDDDQQPLIQFTIGKGSYTYVYDQSSPAVTILPSILFCTFVKVSFYGMYFVIG